VESKGFSPAFASASAVFHAALDKLCAGGGLKSTRQRVASLSTVLYKREMAAAHPAKKLPSVAALNPEQWSSMRRAG
jgi:hypothetical protein